jgi:bifunctional UDP-N-acetylglucosamine pyrophosphorylase/glucosamine-1-phosphate N-acetyltransferase
MGELVAVVLAAGEGKRMKSKNSKVVHKVCGKPLIKWVYAAIRKSGIENCVFVVGHREDQVRACLGDDVSYAVQEKQLGTGHAVMQTEEFLKGRDGTVVVLYE